MKIAVLGLGVIGTTYAYAFQQAGHDTFHIIRDGKQVPASIPVHILDGRYAPKGEEKDGEYIVKPASEYDEYDFILISVASGKLEAAIQTLNDRNLKGTVILFCNFWNERKEVEEILGNYNYITAFPTAGGKMENNGRLNCVLFDHIMLESREKAKAIGLPVLFEQMRQNADPNVAEEINLVIKAMAGEVEDTGDNDADDDDAGSMFDAYEEVGDEQWTFETEGEALLAKYVITDKQANAQAAKIDTSLRSSIARMSVAPDGQHSSRRPVTPGKQ